VKAGKYALCGKLRILSFHDGPDLEFGNMARVKRKAPITLDDLLNQVTGPILRQVNQNGQAVLARLAAVEEDLARLSRQTARDLLEKDGDEKSSAS
jgi:hypothetical protein